jgi:hypothetical protein
MTMAQLEAVSGQDSYVLVGAQTAFGTENTATVTTHLGLIKSFKPRTSNSNQYTRGFKGTTTGGRNVAKIVPTMVDHTVDIEMEVIRWDFLQFLIGTASGSGTVTYIESEQPAYFTMHRCIVNPGGSSTNRDEIWVDCVIDSCTVRCAVNGTVSASLTIKASQRKYDATVVTAQALPSIEVFNFVNSSLQIASSAVTNVIDSLEVTINNNYKIHPGLGSRFAKVMRAGERDYKVKFTVKYLDDGMILKMLGNATPTGTTQPTENTNIIAVFGNNASKTATFTVTTVTFDDLSNTEDINALIQEDISCTAKALTNVVEVQ